MLKVGWFGVPGSHVAFPISGFRFGFPKGREVVMLRANFMANPQSVNPSTPAGPGYSMPAEWEPHAATWLAWPHHEADWPGKMETVRWVYGEMVRKISPGELVRILVRHRAEQKLAASYLKRAGCDLKRVEFVVHPTNRGWMRDSGPIFVKRVGRDAAPQRPQTARRAVPTTETAIVHFHFNAWAKHDDWQKDRRVPEMAARLLKQAAVPRAVQRQEPFVIEGGGIEVNGRGTLLTTEECYLHPENPGAQSRPDEGAIRRDVQEISRREKRALAAQGPGGRRHARAH